MAIMNQAFPTSSAVPSQPPPVGARFRAHSAPTQRGTPICLSDGRALLLRPIAPTDLEALHRCFARLSPQVVRLRFLHAMSALPEPMARQFCCLDPKDAVAEVLMDHSVSPPELRAVGRMYVDATTRAAEFSVLVEHAWSHQGLGALLLQRLVDEARRRGLSEIWGFVLKENRPMLTLARKLGFQVRGNTGEPGVDLIVLHL